MPDAFAPGSAEPDKVQSSLAREDDPPPQPEVDDGGTPVPV